THGMANELDAHPHLSNSGKLAMVHKGIVENYASLKENLLEEGFTFQSETDTEVMVNWIEHIRDINVYSILKAMQIALNPVVGAYSIILMNKEENALYAVRKGAQLVVGVGEGEFVVATDTTPLGKYTENVIYMEEKDVYRLEPGVDIEVLNLDNIEKSPVIEKIEEALEMIEKDGFDHFMLKEIYEQPEVIVDSFRGRMNATEGWVKLGGVNEYRNKLNKAHRIIFA